MGYSSALILLASLATQSWAYPIALADQPQTYDNGLYHWKPTATFDNGQYHWQAETTAVVSTETVQLPAVTTTTPVPALPTTAPAPVIPTTAPAPVIPTTAPAPVLPTTSTTPAPVAATSAAAGIFAEVHSAPSVPSVAAPKSSSPATPTTAASSSADTGTVSASKVAYKKYTGDGSAAAGWPTMSDWVSFEQMWANNQPIMAISCSSQNVEDNTDAEMAQIKAAILAQASATNVDARFILATIMEESTGCVRVKTTASPGDAIRNPGLMQDHSGAGSCSGVAAPCPESEINQMIQDGTAGTNSIAGGGDGLQQTLAQAATYGKDATAVYVAARIYNSGSYHGGALEASAATACYASDIANLLSGFAGAQSPCKLGTA